MTGTNTKNTAKPSTKAKKTTALADKPVDPKKVEVFPGPGESMHDAMARAALSPETQATGTLRLFQNTVLSEHLMAQSVESNLKRQYEAVKAGDLSAAEEMLFSQAQALQTIFHSMAARAQYNIEGGRVVHAETFMRMALKAQSQCRTTIEALGELKFPKSATFIRQQNIANQQQVNNGHAASAMPARAREKDITPTNEQLELSNGEWLDGGKTATAGSIDSTLETMGTVDRPTKQPRQRKGGKERL